MLNHIDENAQPTMVDISAKVDTNREAWAQCDMYLPQEILDLVQDGEINSAKGAVLQTARIAGTMGVKKTSELIPYCHPLPISSIKFEMNFTDKGLNIQCRVKTHYKTGVEMEALTGVQVAALTIYDMCKAVSNEMRIESAQLIKKTGGKSDYRPS